MLCCSYFLICIIYCHVRSDEHHGSLIYKNKHFLYYTEYSFCGDVLEMCLFIVAVHYNVHCFVICVVLHQYQ